MNVAHTWSFDALGPSPEALTGPVGLSRKGMGVPASAGFYVVTAGNCLAHVGTSRSLRSRVGSLARLGTHRGSAEVLCAAYCTREAPVVWWQVTGTEAEAKLRESAFKAHYGEPPQPRHGYESCVNGRALLDVFIAAAGTDTWEAGYAEAVFTIGERLTLLFAGRFDPIWRRIGVPPGPWAISARKGSKR